MGKVSLVLIVEACHRIAFFQHFLVARFGWWFTTMITCLSCQRCAISGTGAVYDNFRVRVPDSISAFASSFRPERGNQLFMEARNPSARQNKVILNDKYLTLTNLIFMIP